MSFLPWVQSSYGVPILCPRFLRTQDFSLLYSTDRHIPRLPRTVSPSVHTIPPPSAPASLPALEPATLPTQPLPSQASLTDSLPALEPATQPTQLLPERPLLEISQSSSYVDHSEGVQPGAQLAEPATPILPLAAPRSHSQDSYQIAISLPEEDEPYQPRLYRTPPRYQPAAIEWDEKDVIEIDSDSDWENERPSHSAHVNRAASPAAEHGDRLILEQVERLADNCSLVADKLDCFQRDSEELVRLVTLALQQRAAGGAAASQVEHKEAVRQPDDSPPEQFNQIADSWDHLDDGPLLHPVDAPILPPIDAAPSGPSEQPAQPDARPLQHTNHSHVYPTEFVSDSDDGSDMAAVPARYTVGPEWHSQRDGLWMAVMNLAVIEYNRIIPSDSSVSKLDAWDRCRKKWALISEQVYAQFYVMIKDAHIKRFAVLNTYTSMPTSSAHVLSRCPSVASFTVLKQRCWVCRVCVCVCVCDTVYTSVCCHVRMCTAAADQVEAQVHHQWCGALAVRSQKGEGGHLGGSPACTESRRATTADND